MKSASEIAQMLLQDLAQNLNNIQKNNSLIYYNEILGDTSFLLAGLLNVLVKKENFIDKIWIDDSLITDIKLLNSNKIFIKGVMIWGKEGTTAQWVDPFEFIMKFDNDLSTFINYTFFYQDFDINEISYEEYRENRYNYEVEKWRYEFKS
ncbi:hypothetical protein ACM46_16925 [Chryseobacterium angstadtii]|uniref:Uncharacterized protein n=1 Tax=Chryseobacterium angstadtii TaxID=558151 RepID=A0A0J7I0X3_9FLAO|nr:hypothetical protein [Chryseobacterium angstadtii]KMQ59942.1 hypothetical protein ACM46_16925 [Chryseobacterium angstadtii]